MEDGWKSYRLTDRSQTISSVLSGSLWSKKSCFASSHGAATCCQDDDIVFQQFLDDNQVRAVMHGSGIVAAHHAADPADPAVDDIVVQWGIGPTEGSSQMVVDGFIAEADHHFFLVFGNKDLGGSVGIVVDSGLDNPFGIFQGMMFVKLYMNGIAGSDFTAGIGGNQLGMIALGHIGQVLHDALDIDHHGIHRPGNDGQLLL